MANTKSAKKAIRVSERRRLENRPIRSAVRTYFRRAVEATASPSDASTAATLSKAISALDKAAHKNVIHPNNAARRKSRLMARLNKAIAAGRDA